MMARLFVLVIFLSLSFPLATEWLGGPHRLFQPWLPWLLSIMSSSLKAFVPLNVNVKDLDGPDTIESYAKVPNRTMSTTYLLFHELSYHYDRGGCWSIVNSR